MYAVESFCPPSPVHSMILHQPTKQQRLVTGSNIIFLLLGYFVLVLTSKPVTGFTFSPTSSSFLQQQQGVQQQQQLRHYYYCYRKDIFKQNMLTSKDGDRVEEGDDDKIVITPLSPDTKYNFGPASKRDYVVNTCERPGGDPPNKEIKLKTNEVVNEWIEFMTTPERNIKHVLVLMDANELEVYESPGLLDAYQNAGINVYHTPLSADNAYETIMSKLDDIELKGERAVAHCTHGMGRSGRIAAAWLVHKYGLSAEDASEEALDTARTHGVERLGSTKKLQQWMTK